MPYPCFCVPCVDCVTPPTPCPSGNCLLIPGSITIDPTTSVLPCGGVGIVDIATLSDTSNCGGSIVWQLISYNTTAFTSASIDSSTGELTFTTSDDAVVGTYYDFVVKAMCDTGILSAFTTVKIPIKNGCYAVVCDEGSSCNPCTGFCIEDLPDIIIE